MIAAVKKILIIAYHFPPDAAVGALRPQKFAKYLPEFGWKPQVLTIRERQIEKLDETRLADVVGVDILRTPFWRSPLQLTIDIRDRLRGYQSEGVLKGALPVKDTYHLLTKESLRSKLKRYFIAFNMFPDNKLWWTIPAVVTGFIRILRDRIPLIYATAPPPTVAIVGYLLSLLSGARLIVELRDPWIVAEAQPPDHIRWNLIENWKSKAEHAVMRKAHLVICTTDILRRALIAHYHDLPSAKFITITNGYDASDITARQEKHNSKFIISYLGTFYLGRSPKSFFQALQGLIYKEIIPRNSVEVHLIGNVEYCGGESVQEMAERCGVGNLVHLTGLLPHREAMQKMSTSDLLLLLAPNQPHMIPAKAFEYIGTRRPILTLTDDGATAELIRSVNAGLVVSQEDVVGIAEALRIFYGERQNSTRWYESTDISRFERRNLTAQLARYLDTVVEKGQP